MRRTLLSFILLSCFVGTMAQYFEGPQAEIDAILAAGKRFSAHVVAARVDSIAAYYTVDGKVFPNRSDILVGHDAIRKMWVTPDSTPTIRHQLEPIEILVRGNEAIDHGYYEGETRYPDGKTDGWRGKYVAIWRKEKGQWRMYLDIWNRL